MAHENLYTDNAGEDDKVTIASFEMTTSLFREEDTHIFTDTLKLYYDLFCLFHHSLQALFEKDKKLLESVLMDFTSNFDKHFFHND